jgi:anti-anti-sigma factor
VSNFGITAHGSTQFSLKGELDLATAPLMTLAIADAAFRGGPITMDMTDVTFMDSTSVEAIVRLARALPSGCILLHGLQVRVGRVMDIMGVGDAPPNLHMIPCSLVGDRYGGDAEPSSEALAR